MLSYNRKLFSKASAVATASCFAKAAFSSSAARLDLAPLDFSKLTVKKTSQPKELLPNDKLVFGQTFTGMY